VARPDVAGLGPLLAAAADPEAAATLARFFQVRPGGYGEGDHFIGLGVATIRRLVAPWVREPCAPAEWLPWLGHRTHEYRLATLVVWAERARRGGPDELTALHHAYLAHTDRVDNWDLVDVSCAAIVGGYLLTRDRAELDRLARSRSLWERRIAVISTHRFLRAGESADAYRLCDTLLDDPHDLIRKAVGWTLREAGRRCGPDGLRTFLDGRAGTMPRTSLRYAVEHFPAAERRHYREDFGYRRVR
jgi:3-methyladenine DNA glycosylase AlkD